VNSILTLSIFFFMVLQLTLLPTASEDNDCF
jgi:hypothetical protein